MKISLITTLLSLVENKRIEEEVKALGHDFELIDLKNFGFILKEDSFFIPQLSLTLPAGRPDSAHAKWPRSEWSCRGQHDRWCRH